MGDKETFLGEVGKKIPIDKVYDDILHPALSEVGHTLQGLVKVSLAPISAIVWGYDKISSYLDEAIPQYFKNKKISEEKIISPDPAIAVPTIEAMRYTNKGILRQMYVDILGASMNKDTADFIHPSFVEVIKQLTPDEAKIIKELPHKGLHEPLMNIKVEKKNVKGTFVIYRNCGILGYECGCVFPNKISLYVDNLKRLALVEVPENACLIDEWRYDKIAGSDYFKALSLDAEKEGKVLYEKRMIGLTDYGMLLKEICLS